MKKRASLFASLALVFFMVVLLVHQCRAPEMASASSDNNLDRSGLLPRNVDNRLGSNSFSSTNMGKRLSNLSSTALSFFVNTNPDNPDLNINQMNFSDALEHVGPPTQDNESVKAYNHGAHSKLTIHIVDEEGKPVTGAKISAVHYKNWICLKSEQLTTDDNGFVVLENKQADRYTIGTVKEGYYGSFGDICFFSGYCKCVGNGMWLPWNPQVEWVLKTMGAPVRLKDYDIKRSYNATNSLPLEIDLPFDFLLGDFLPPWGIGLNTNAFFRFSGAKKQNEIHVIERLSFSSGGGVSIAAKDGFCDYKYPKRLDKGIFSSHFSHEYRRTTHGDSVQRIDTDPTSKKYIALKVPVSSCNETHGDFFGILYNVPRADLTEDSSGVAFFSMRYFLNPEPNDRRIESPDQLRL